MDSWFALKRVATENDKIAAVHLALRDDAVVWFNSLVKKDQRPDNRKSFCTVARTRFIRRNLQMRLPDQLRLCTQGEAGNSENYIQRFEFLVAQIENMSDVDLLHSFIDGLGTRYRPPVIDRNPPNWQDAVSVTLDVQRGLKLAYLVVVTVLVHQQHFVTVVPSNLCSECRCHNQATGNPGYRRLHEHVSRQHQHPIQGP